jgi:prephenate dehydrogenase
VSFTVSIVGLGLMGASLGQAIRDRRVFPRVTGWARRAETRRLARAAGLEVAETLAESVRPADLVVLCTPVLTFEQLLTDIRPHLKPGAVVTDVGSTKVEVIAAAEKVLSGAGVCFVGSHPMAGSEKTGWEAGRADLYEKATVIVVPPVTPGPAASAAVARVVELWTGVGGRVVQMTARVHDDLVARTSHLPHLLSALLVQTVARDGTESVRDLCGPGFRDTTRLADGSPEMWHDIVQTNRPVIAAELRALRDQLDLFLKQLEAGDGESVRAYLDGARVLREKLLSARTRSDGRNGVGHERA